MSPNPAAAYLCRSRVRHRRFDRFRYDFVYPFFRVWVDIDRLSRVDRASRIFRYNRPGAVSLRDRDHGARDDSPLRPWLEGHLEAHGVTNAQGPIYLFAFPRILGYGFNPLSLWFAYSEEHSLKAVLFEVHNTFGERHSYLVHRAGETLTWPIRSHHDKTFYVSPFLPMDLRYAFALYRTGERLRVVVKDYTPEGELKLVAIEDTYVRPLTDRSLGMAVARFPFSSLRAMALIHWQALKLWFRGARPYRRPSPPASEVS